MARKKGHHRLKPAVNPITYVILGLTFVVLTLAIILSVDTKNQRFKKVFNIESNIFTVSKLSAVEKQIDKGKNTLVYFRVVAEEALNPKPLIEQLILINEGDSHYPDQTLFDLVEKVHYVEVLEKHQEIYDEFREKYELELNNTVLLVYFQDGEVVAELNLNKQHPNIHPEGQDGADLINLRKNVIEFLNKLTEEAK